MTALARLVGLSALCSGLGLGLPSSASFAQDLLVNGDFENVAAPVFGDNTNFDIAPWFSGFEVDREDKFQKKLVVVKVNGTDKDDFAQAPIYWDETNMTGFQSLLPFNDASAGGAAITGHYLRNNFSGGSEKQIHIFQWFIAPRSGCVAFGAAIRSASPRSVLSNILLSELDMNAIYGPLKDKKKYFQATLGMVPSSSATAIFQQTNPDSWTTLTGHKKLQAGNNYSFHTGMFSMVLLDDAFVTYVDDSKCS